MYVGDCVLVVVDLNSLLELAVLVPVIDFDQVLSKLVFAYMRWMLAIHLRR